MMTTSTYYESHRFIGDDHFLDMQNGMWITATIHVRHTQMTARETELPRELKQLRRQQRTNRDERERKSGGPCESQINLGCDMKSVRTMKVMRD